MLNNIAIPVQSLFLLAFQNKNVTKIAMTINVSIKKNYTDIISMLAAS